MIESIVSTLLAAIAPAVIRSFAEILHGFGAGLPRATRIVLAGSYGAHGLAAISIGITFWILKRKNPSETEIHAMWRAVSIYAIAFGAVLAWAIVALFQPIFGLGNPA